MPWISQSTVLESSPTQVFKLLSVRPFLIPSAPVDVTIGYYFDGEIKKGQSVTFTLYFGLHKLEWKGVVSEFIADKSYVIESAESSYFSFFRSEHQVKEFSDKTLLREQIEFRALTPDLEKALGSSFIQHALSYRKEKSIEETQQMSVINDQRMA